MASQKRSFGERLVRWQSLVRNGKPFFEQEVPQAVPDVIELESVAAEIAQLHSERMRLQGQLRHTTKRVRELSRQADRLRGRIGATLRGRFGYDSSKLGAFGFKARDRKPAAETGTPAPVAAGQAPDSRPEGPEEPEATN